MRTRKHILSIATVALLGFAVTGSLAIAQKKDSPDVLLQRAIQKEMVDGDLKAAIELYKKVLTAPGVSPRIAADALVHMGQAYERAGDAEARNAYERVLREQPGQADAVATAQHRLAVLNLNQRSGSLTARLICQDCGGDSDGSMAQNGTLLATTDWVNGGVTLRDISTGRITRIATDDTYPQYPLLSPDSRFIAYSVHVKGEREKLYVINRETGAKPVLLADDPAFQSFVPDGWFPDGKSLLVEIRNTDNTWQIARVSVTEHTVKTLRSLQLRTAGVASHPSVSPDGRYVAYAAAAKNPSKQPRSPAEVSTDQRIYVVATDGSGKEEEMTRESSQNDSPIWTADGKHILFVSDRSNSIGLWAVAVQDGHAIGSPQLVRPNTGRISPLTFTSGGSFYYTGNQTSYDEVLVADVRSGTQQGASLSIGERTPGGQTPGWSLDGKSVAFSRLRFGERNIYDVVARNVDSGEEKKFIHNGFAAGYEMIWFHDNSSFLAWASEPTEPSNKRVIYRVNTATSEWQPLMTLDISALAPATGISADDQTLYKGGRDSQSGGTPSRPFDRIFSFDLKTGQQKQVLKLPEPAYTFRLSPDGKTFMLMLQPDGQKQEFYLARMSVDGGNYRRLAGPFMTPVGAWAGDGRQFFFTESDKPGPQNPTAKSKLMRISTDSDKPEFTGMTLTGLNGFAVNPNGSRIAYSITRPGTTEVWALDNISSVLNQ
jgi:Tol biopolymer transport system component